MTVAVRPLAIIGPTGTGKSQLALDFAERVERLGVRGEIVNADAMQLYRGMDIGTAKLPVEARRGIPHHQLDVFDVTETATVARYQGAAAADIEAIAARGAVPIIVGGSMLYIQSLLDDWSFPATDPAVRARWEQRLAEIGVGELHAELARRDPAAAASILPTDARRTVRALEVVELTGQPFAASAPRIGAPRWDTVIVGLDCDTTILDERLARRTDAMFDRGLLGEVIGTAGEGLARRRHRVTRAGLRAGARGARCGRSVGPQPGSPARGARPDVCRHPALCAAPAVLVSPGPPGAMARCRGREPGAARRRRRRRRRGVAPRILSR